eukprot:2330558-Amphidinium_carterae.1
MMWKPCSRLKDWRIATLNANFASACLLRGCQETCLCPPKVLATWIQIPEHPVILRAVWQLNQSQCSSPSQSSQPLAGIATRYQPRQRFCLGQDKQASSPPTTTH